MSQISRFFPKVHPLKALLRRHRVPVAALASFLGLSASYTCSLLNGFARVTPAIEEKLEKFARLVEAEAKGEV